MEIDIAYATTEQLIKELMNRKLFVGILVYCEREVKNKKRGVEQKGSYRVKCTSNISKAEVQTIITEAGKAITKC